MAPEPPMNAGARYYGAITLPLYDLAVLGVAVPLCWGCPVGEVQALYDRNLGAAHLDVGVATGRFLHRAAWAAPDKSLTLMDLNPRAARYAAHRLRRYAPEILTGDARAPFPTQRRFNSIGLTHLLHCIPGDISAKASVFDHAAARLAPGGVVFGASVTPKGARKSPQAALLLAAMNRIGALNNALDSHDALRAALEARFATVRIWRRGLSSLFEARGPR